MMGLESLIGSEGMKKIVGKPFGIDPFAKYDSKDFVKKAGELFRLEKHYSDIMKNSGDLNAINSLTEIALPYMPGSSGDNAQLLRDSLIASQQAEILLGVGNKKMVSYVGKNLKSLVKNLSQEGITAFAVGLGLRDKKYLVLSQALRMEDREAMVNLVRDNFLERNKDYKGLVELAKTWGPETWIGYASYGYGRMQKEFTRKNLYSSATAEKSGKKYTESKYDSSKASKYLIKTIAGLKGEEKNRVLLELSKIIYQSTAREAEKKAA